MLRVAIALFAALNALTAAEILSLALVDPATGRDVRSLVDNDRISSPRPFSIRAEVDSISDTSSVAFYVNDRLEITERASPYFIAGDRPGRVFPWSKVPDGSFVVRVVQRGEASGEISLTLSVGSASAAAARLSPAPVSATKLSTLPSLASVPNAKLTVSPSRVPSSSATINSSASSGLTASVSFGTTATPTPRPTRAPARRSPSPKWATVSTTGEPTGRHEACFVMVKGKGYLLGGRGSRKPVDVFDPATRTWTRRDGAGVELHHMQCVAVGSRVYVVSAWTGGYPNESSQDKIYIYDTKKDEWSTKPGLVERRRRGGAAAVLHKGKIYVTHGNRGGHGSQAKTLGWMDAYHIASNTWETNLPNAPHPRDHTGGAIVNGKLCVAGGRDGGVDDFFNSPVLPTDCYNFETAEWETHDDIPAGRAGAAYGATCDGSMMIAGGEGDGKAFNNVDVYDGLSWTSAPSLQVGRHGSGLAVASCECGQIVIASGAKSQGGGKEITSTEIYFPDGDTRKKCK